MINKTSVLERVLLNPQQKTVVECDQWPQLVFAGAGTGKTRVLTAKIAFLIEQKGVRPERIFAATFTNKAASEMRSRVESIISMPCAGMWIGTFHSLCVRLLRRNADCIGYNPSFTIYDRDDQLSCVRAVMKELEVNERTIQPQHALAVISHNKNLCCTPEQYSNSAKDYYHQELLKIYQEYQKRLVKHQAMDFDDLITNTVYLLRTQNEILKKYQETFQYVLVDEYQDTNASQLNLVRLLGGGHGKVFVVGDDDQSIYAWRGAQIENILCFEEHFPSSRVFKLEQNYRSSQKILDFANAVIIGNSRRAQKTLWTSQGGGSDVTVARYGDDRQEAEGIVNKAREFSSKGMKLGDMAVLFRTNAQSRAFEDALRKRNIPYILVGGTSFYERKEIKDCLAYLKILVNSSDDVSCDRILNVPSRGIGEKSRDTMVAKARAAGLSMLDTIISGDWGDAGAKAQKGFGEFRDVFVHLREMMRENKPVNEILDEMLTLSGYMDELENEESEDSERRIDNINELMNAMTIWTNENPGRELTDFLEEITLVSDIDRWDPDTDAINLMTLHCAKGLEFNAVFLAGVEDGLLPSRQNSDDTAKIEEECRLFYVGCTRAMQILECSHVDRRWRFGTVIPMSPSRFLQDVPQELYRMDDHTQIIFTPEIKPLKRSVGSTENIRKDAFEKRIEPVRDEYSQDEVMYRMGQTVIHRMYGKGKILNVSGFGPDMRLTILFQDGSRKKIMARFANLETL